MNNIRMKILLAVLAVLVVLAVANYFTKADGYITVTVQEIDGDVLAEKEIG